MFKGLQRPLFRGNNWEVLFDKDSKEYSFMVGNTILFVDRNGNPLHVKVLGGDGRVRNSTQITKMTILMDHALRHYARQHNVQLSEEEVDENEAYGMTVEVEPEEPKQKSGIAHVVRKIRRKFKL